MTIFDILNREKEVGQQQAFFELCNEHIDHARSKHPKFAFGVSAETMETLRTLAELYRKECARPWADVQMVILGEIYEFLEALKSGNRQRALEEGADIVAVVYRATHGDIVAPKKEGDA
ncbi:MAG: hypothetical protein IKW38_00225 [Kiritimatiellae bacterium]|nr:hypothetical protein [Kiritimatiellia bacterium]